MPLSTNGIAAISVFAFTSAWNEFMFAITFLRSPSNWTAVAGIRSFIGEWTVSWDYAMIASTYFVIPALIFYFFTQKYFIKGMTAGAVKGA